MAVSAGCPPYAVRKALLCAHPAGPQHVVPPAPHPQAPPAQEQTHFILGGRCSTESVQEAGALSVIASVDPTPAMRAQLKVAGTGTDQCGSGIALLVQQAKIC